MTENVNLTYFIWCSMIYGYMFLADLHYTRYFTCRSRILRCNQKNVKHFIDLNHKWSFVSMFDVRNSYHYCFWKKWNTTNLTRCQIKTKITDILSSSELFHLRLVLCAVFRYLPAFRNADCFLACVVTWFCRWWVVEARNNILINLFPKIGFCK